MVAVMTHMVDGTRVSFRPCATHEIMGVRHEMLRPGRPIETAAFPGDDAPSTLHFGAFALDPSGAERVGALGCLTFLSAGRGGVAAWQLRGMATSSAVLRRGIGSRLLACAEAHLAAAGAEEGSLPVELWANARVSALAFYARQGWAQEGEVFDVPGIGAHVVIVKRLHAAPAMADARAGAL
ncbi:hypothetical protein KFE25_011775 [Diacronema lutheri]|uniref:N-acetyltransferase domain-containing protein n=2 Tax=Diacronema lutheri TaxID=2081491 RepID=A0A8J6C4K1_DIALT|nr:hypothetical protein KFE25_011775 [Diacronema lutheri]